VIQAGRVRVNGLVQRDPERFVSPDHDRIEVDGKPIRAGRKIYLMLNKPRGLVTSAADEQGRATVYECLKELGGRATKGLEVKSPDGYLPRVFPVGRLDKASEGLLLFTNDSKWADEITAPESHLDKTYHVQVDCLADDSLTRRMTEGVNSEGEHLAAKRVKLLRHGEKNSWLEIVLDEGRNRHIRRLLAALGIEVLRLLRVAIGPLQLGSLVKGETRVLTEAEVAALKKGAR